jgi:putative oxidoreductase
MQLDKKNDWALLIFRLAFGGFMIIGHGWPKLLRLLGDEPVKFMDFMGLGPTVSLALATFAELGCALLIMVGLYTRLALLPLIFTMLVAIIGRHWGDPFGLVEKALMYLFAYLGILLTGPGWFSLDAQWRKV